MSDKKRKLRTLIKVFGTLIMLNVVVIFLFIYSTPGEEGSGVLQTKTIQLAPFDMVILEDLGTARITIGDSSFVEITTDENILPLLDINVDDGNLVIQNKEEIHPSVLLITIHTPTLRGLKVAGKSTVEVSDLAGEHFSIGVRDDGIAHVAGMVNRLEVKIHGDGKVKALDLITDETRIDLQGKGYVVVHTRDRLVIHCEGRGKVSYAGSPVVDNNCSGIVEPI